MNSHAYDTFSDELLAQAEADPTVLGLIALGSMANHVRRDKWSDHDFFWIVAAGCQERYRKQIDWLPNHDQVVLWFRETDHGLKIIYRDGHLLELAVFDPDELAVAKINDYAVLFDRGGIAERARKLAADSVPAAIDSNWELSSVHVIGHLLRLITAVVPSNNHAILDGLDAFRRFEGAYPQLGAQIATALTQETLRCAWLLADLIEYSIKPRIQLFPDAALTTLRAHLRTVAPDTCQSSNDPIA